MARLHLGLLIVVWRNIETARLALLMYADAYGMIQRPVLTMDWTTIQSATVTVQSHCVDGLQSGGVWVVSGTYAVPYHQL